MNKLYNMFKGIALNAMASRTIEADPLQSFMFRVSIPGLPTGVGFQKVGGLSREVEVVEYLENMYDHTHKLPGRETVSDVTFERGMYADDYLQGIYEKVFNNNTVRNTVVIQVCDRFGKIRREFKCAEAWFSKYECADLDATSSDVIIETLTMTFEYFL
jgi:phage tail-like protein|nr:MAG TPA: major tail protein [Caudoviricetes sp.]